MDAVLDVMTTSVMNETSVVVMALVAAMVSMDIMVTVNWVVMESVLYVEEATTTLAITIINLPIWDP